jgi:hypothetical protein
MNIYKFLKPVLPAVMLISAAGFIAGCSSSSDDTSSGDTPAAPPVPLVGITGIWTGTFDWQTTGQSKTYQVTMMFHTPDDVTEGTAIGLALGNGPNDIDLPHFLFEGGYIYSAEPLETTDPDTNQPVITCEGGVWAIGRDGQEATFVQEYSYVTGSAGGPDQRGAGCLYLTDADGDGYENELTGQMSFEEAGKFAVTLTYSEDNARDVAITDLGVVGSDQGAYDAPDDVKYHLWSNDNSGNFMNYNATYIDVGDISLTYLVVSEDHPTADCGGLIVVSRIEGQNLFALRLPEDSPVNGCNVTDVPGNWTQDGSDYITNNVNLPFYGLGALFDTDGDGNLEFVHMMASKQSGAGSTSQVLHNRFLVQ